jgi:hypothetical protein
LVIAAHADVCTYSGFSSNAGAFIATLPETATVNVLRTKLISYFQTTITNGDFLNGIYEGWCIDTDRSIGKNIDYCANVYSSYEPLPLGLIEYPENLDLVNWLINQDFVGKDYPLSVLDPPETFTMGDVQFAIWELIEDIVPYASAGDMGSWSHEKVNYLVAEAYANGEGFVPGCIPPQNRMIVMLVPYDFPPDCAPSEIPIAQITFISVPVPCVPEDCETAWGDGDDFPGKKWAMYIAYTIQ